MDWARIIDNIEKNVDKIGISKSDLPRTLEVRPQFISDLKSGKSKNPNSDFALALITKLNINPHWLHSGEGEMLLASLPLKVEHGLTRTDNGFKVPLLRQKVSCGPGVNWEDEQNIVDYIDIFSGLPSLKIRRLFALCVEGSSMIGAGIQNGDYVLFDARNDQRLHDGLYVFALDGDVYCKRLEFDMTKIRIFSVRFTDLDKAELMMTLDASDMMTADRFTIFGRVVYCVHPNYNDD
jgi:SOS-response transcriptional repressor LexA